MIKRSRRQLDLSAFGQLFMDGNDPLHDFALLVQQPALLAFGVSSALRAKFPQARVEIEGQLMDPGQVAPNLKIAEIARGETGNGIFDRIRAEAAFEIQLVIPLVRADHAVDVGHEEIVQQVDNVFRVHSIGRHPRDVEMAIASSVRVREELYEQAGNEVDRAAELGHLFEVQGHAVVVLGRVQADPGHQRLAADVVRVVRLMLVPEEGQRDRLHGFSVQGP